VEIDRPETRNVLTIAMYFGLRFALERDDRRRAGTGSTADGPRVQC
jgi:hypothetical protein